MWIPWHLLVLSVSATQASLSLTYRDIVQQQPLVRNFDQDTRLKLHVSECFVQEINDLLVRLPVRLSSDELQVARHVLLSRIPEAATCRRGASPFVALPAVERSDMSCKAAEIILQAEHFQVLHASSTGFADKVKANWWVLPLSLSLEIVNRGDDHDCS